jgi:hypothetical protein
MKQMGGLMRGCATGVVLRCLCVYVASRFSAHSRACPRVSAVSKDVDVPGTCADEMIIGYVEVMTKMDKKLTEHDKFYGGDAKEIRRRLIDQKQAAGASACIALCA